jgi:integral membrane sensor domain MASE1
MTDKNRDEIERIKATDPFLIWYRKKEAEINDRVRRDVREQIRIENWLIAGAVVPPLISAALCIYFLYAVKP